MTLTWIDLVVILAFVVVVVLLTPVVKRTFGRSRKTSGLPSDYEGETPDPKRRDD